MPTSIFLLIVQLFKINEFTTNKQLIRIKKSSFNEFSVFSKLLVNIQQYGRMTFMFIFLVGIPYIITFVIIPLSANNNAVIP